MTPEQLQSLSFQERRKALVEYLNSIKNEIILGSLDRCIIAKGLSFSGINNILSSTSLSIPRMIKEFSSFFGMNYFIVDSIFWNSRDKVKNAIKRIADYKGD